MPRKPVGDKAQTSAERQRAYRERRRLSGLRQAWIPDPDQSAAAVKGPIEMDDLDDEEDKAPRPPSRPRRWAKALADIEEAAADLIELREEYEYWRDNLPDNQRDGITAEKLDATIAAVEAFEETLEAALGELENVDLPLGFGRD